MDKQTQEITDIIDAVCRRFGCKLTLDSNGCKFCVRCSRMNNFIYPKPKPAADAQRITQAKAELAEWLREQNQHTTSVRDESRLLQKFIEKFDAIK